MNDIVFIGSSSLGLKFLSKNSNFKIIDIFCLKKRNHSRCFHVDDLYKNSYFLKKEILRRYTGTMVRWYAGAKML